MNNLNKYQLALLKKILDAKLTPTELADVKHKIEEIVRKKQN